MANDINSAIDMLRGILGSDADDKIRNTLSDLAGNMNYGNNENADSSSNLSESMNKNINNNINIDENALHYISQLRGVFDEMSKSGDNRSNLLMSLRPYMSEGRQQSIDMALKFIAVTRLANAFKNFGG